VEGQDWCYKKQAEAHRVVQGMINQWGLHVLQAGAGVIDIGGDPGFVAAELLYAGIRTTVVDPAFGMSGKANPAISAYLKDQTLHKTAESGTTPFTVIRRPFNQDFVDDPANQDLVTRVSAIVSLYPDEATDFLLHFTAARALRTAIIPCNECRQYFPPQNPTYEGFVTHLLQRDNYTVSLYGHGAFLRQEWLTGTPFCRVILQRTPPHLGTHDFSYCDEGYEHHCHSSTGPYSKTTVKSQACKVRCKNVSRHDNDGRSNATF